MHDTFEVGGVVPSTHIVQQGEHLSRIAEQYGFTDFLPIWNHPNNAALKALRQNPNILFPGDSLLVPDRETREEDRSTDKRHPFRMPVKPLELRVVLHRVYGPPYASATCTLTIGPNRTDLTSDGSAKIEQPIAKADENAALTVKDQVPVHGAMVALDREIQMKIGHLDPIDQPSGQQARLANLGYYRGPDTPLDPDEFLSAVEEFQCENHLAIDGKCGPNTQAKLKTVYGC